MVETIRGVVLPWHFLFAPKPPLSPLNMLFPLCSISKSIITRLGTNMSYFSRAKDGKLSESHARTRDPFSPVTDYLASYKPALVISHSFQLSLFLP